MTHNLHVCAICCRPEVDSDVISGVAVDNVGVHAPIEFGDSRSNGFRYIRGADFVSNERCSNERTLPKPTTVARNDRSSFGYRIVRTVSVY